MATSIEKKEFSFGGCHYDKTSPRREMFSAATKRLNVKLSFEDALKLNIAIDECVRKLNSYKRSTRRGKRSGLNLSLHLGSHRITVNETQIEPSE